MNHRPLIKNSNTYFIDKKYISINSEDRDATKYPNASEFEISLPQEYTNVVSARLYSWSFPANYDVFSQTNLNIILTFNFTNLYNPNNYENTDGLAQATFAALTAYGQEDIILNIQPGFYNPYQIAVELTNRFNEEVSKIVQHFLNTPEGEPYAENIGLFKNYDRFRIVYNSVSQKLWFGNKSDKFILTNNSQYLAETLIANQNCRRSGKLPEWYNSGLPSFLGFTKCNATSYSIEEYTELTPSDNNVYIGYKNTTLLPRFFYGDAIPNSGDNGFWLLPDPTLIGSTLYFLQAPLKINVMGQAYIYMEVEGMNSINETMPFNLSNYTMTNSNTNGIVNSAFAKLPVPTTPVSQWFGEETRLYKYWNPPAERIAKLKIKFRYHNNVLVEFGNFPYSFMIEFNVLTHQPDRSYNIVNSYDLAQNHVFS
jgi:hypothetical protein